MRWIVGLCLLAIVGCANIRSPVGDGPVDIRLDAGGDLHAPVPGPPCGTGDRVLPKGLTELKSDSGKRVSHLRKLSRTLTVNGKKVALAKVPVREAKRFTLSQPTKIYGFSVQWTNISPGKKPEALLQAGLYRDFGHNGFDFWAAEPLWAGTRCVKDVVKGKWLNYVFDKPVEVKHPGLVYVAHRADSPEDPLFYVDDNPVNKCEKFTDCSSSLNLSATDVIPSGRNYSGASFPFEYNYMVRLWIEPKSGLPLEPLFKKQSGPKSNRGSVSWGDYDNDGWDDLLVGGSLYHNIKGSFVDVTQASGIGALKTRAAGGVWGDYNNDGCLDLFLFAEQYDHADRLLKGNCEGSFADVTAAAKIVDHPNSAPCGNAVQNVLSPSAAAAWIDIDADGFLDLYIANFICWTNYSYYTDSIFRNRGDGTFEDWTGKKGFSNMKSASRGAAPIDYDGDGDVDLFVHNYVLQPNLLYRNNGDGSVTESAKRAGVMGNARFFSQYEYGHSIGSAWGDLDNDGDFDLVVANLAHSQFWHFSDRTQILINDGKGSFKDISGIYNKPYGNPSGLRYQTTHSVPVLADFANSGNLDLVMTCVYDGHPTGFYWGKGDGTFELLGKRPSGISTTNGWGAAVSDYDNDGDLDLFATDLFQFAYTPPLAMDWIQVRVVGNKGANWAAIGATVKVNTSKKSYLRHVQGGSGKGCQDSLYLHFGLGRAGSASVSSIMVTFPGGKRVTYPGASFNTRKRYWLYEDGSVHEGWGPSR